MSDPPRVQDDRPFEMLANHKVFKRKNFCTNFNAFFINSQFATTVLAQTHWLKPTGSYKSLSISGGISLSVARNRRIGNDADWPIIGDLCNARRVT